jgi:hypothetical protein
MSADAVENSSFPQVATGPATINLYLKVSSYPRKGA